MNAAPGGMEAAIDALVGQISDSVRAGRTPDEAARRLAQIAEAGLVEQALRRYRTLTRNVRTMREPGAIIDPFVDAWYPGPSDDDKFWPKYKETLRRRGWDDRSIAELDTASTKIVSLLSPPGAGSIRTRGLVLGHVQSGKTANFTSVISKAADAGYRFFLVLSGVSNALRNQTQRRLEEDLVALQPEDWIALTGPARDFREAANVNAFLSERQASKVLGVVKKNASRLRRLRDWLRAARDEVLRACPILVIDDEADQASPNAHPDPGERTAINRLLVELLLTLPKAAYVGYTATPFANLFIDPAPEEDLYPRHFIVDLPRAEAYFGPERIFGREPLDWENPDEVADGLDMIRLVPDDEVQHLRPASRDERFAFVPQITPSLADALSYFWMATAARRARSQTGEHSTMLIHTTEYSAVHDAFRAPVERFRDHLAESLRAQVPATLGSLQGAWEREQAAVPPENVGERGVPFEALVGRLAEVVAATEVKVENARSSERIEYDPTAPRTYVVIGGNVLSRGLTLEGLSVSFFIRGASAYDTLLQMGRWFGYRSGYADLPRIWLTNELRDFFYDLATVEREIRVDIDQYKESHITPLTLAVRIRTHPHLAITSKLKMQYAVPAKMSFAGHAVQTIVFKHRDRAWLERNLQAVRAFVRRLVGEGLRPQRVQERPHWVLRDVPVDAVLSFLGEYQIHEKHVEMRSDLIQSYIRDQNARNKITRWNVVIVTRTPDPELGAVNLGVDGEVALVNRARFMRGGPEFADIKALMSGIDSAIDLDIATTELRGKSKKELLRLRADANPLLLLYPISRNSQPRGAATRSAYRRPLESQEHVVGIGLVFPSADDDTPQGYMSADLSRVPQEKLDIDDLPEDER